MRRQLFLLRGSAEETRSRAGELLNALGGDDVLWAGPEDTTARAIGRLLGRSFTAVVVDLHNHLDPNLLARCQGFVLGGGALIVRMGDEPPLEPSLAAEGCSVHAVTSHLWHRIERVLDEASEQPARIEPSTFVPMSTADQRRVVHALTQHAKTTDIAVLTAKRGRGKSAALGLAARDVTGKVLITATSREAVGEALAFASGATDLAYIPTPELVDSRPPADLILVDEAAQLPVALLRRLVSRYPTTPIVFSTTTHGYEGTGRGFSLKFVAELRDGARPLAEWTLDAPIRWDADDQVEAAIDEALLLDAEPAPASLVRETLVTRKITREELVADDALLREVFGLLVHAHYKTSPADLHRLLDAPNLSIHAALQGDRVLGATLVAREGGITAALAKDLAHGGRRLVGHALPESFAAHLGQPAMAQLSMLRSVRIATHPDVRQRGIATRLVDHVHAHYEVDLFGTLFGASPELLEFRRSLGYEIVRLSASRGRSTGVPSVVMVRPVTPEAIGALALLRADLARDLPVQLDLCEADGSLRLDATLRSALLAGLGDPAPLTRTRRDEIARSYAFGPRTFESAAVAVTDFASSRLAEIDEPLRTLVRLRAIERRSWADAARGAGIDSMPAAMRGLRRAVRQLFDA